MFIYILISLFFLLTSPIYAEEQEFWQQILTVRQIESTTSNKITPIISKINLNTANKESLQKLRGIGEKRAKAIFDFRQQNGPYQTINDLVKIKGFTKKFLAKLEADNVGILEVK